MSLALDHDDDRTLGTHDDDFLNAVKGSRVYDDAFNYISRRRLMKPEKGVVTIVYPSANDYARSRSLFPRVSRVTRSI